MHTKKVGSIGRYGSRYGTRVRKINLAIEKVQKKRQECPYCERMTLKRVASGIWTCKKCKVKFAGGAYFPKTNININMEKKGE